MELPNLTRVTHAKAFYGGILGLNIVMDHKWIVSRDERPSAPTNGIRRVEEYR